MLSILSAALIHGHKSPFLSSIVRIREGNKTQAAEDSGLLRQKSVHYGQRESNSSAPLFPRTILCYNRVRKGLSDPAEQGSADGSGMIDYFAFSMDPAAVRQISNLGLAHMGDAVYELLVRAWACGRGVKAEQLHLLVVAHVAAPRQAESARLLLPRLTEEEQAVFRRARNSRVHGVPQASSVEEYHLATALEALFGWLYLTGRQQRISELFEMVSRGWSDAV